MVKNRISKFAGFLAAVVLASVNINSVEGADISSSTELTNSSNYRGTVNITNDIKLDSGLSPVSIENSNVTINGNDKTIDMNGNNSNLWTFNSSKTGETIKDLTFTNIGASAHGLIYANVNSNVSVNNVSIVDSTIASATNIWGNIVSVCNNSTANIDNLTVSNVSITAANSGEADGVSGLVLYLQRRNGYAQSNASLKNSNINNNTITTNNRAAYGGIIANEGIMTEISGTTFKGNTVQNNSSSNGVYGGVIANGTSSSSSSSSTITTISGSNFIENGLVSSGKVNSKGGAIYNTGTIGSITNSIFTGNYAQSNGGTAQGGAIYTDKGLTIKADGGTTKFSGNYVSTDGGTTKNNEAIYVDNSSATLTLSAIDNGTFIMNDYINGKDGYTLKLSADDNSSFYLNNIIKGTPKATLTNVTVDWQNNTLDNVSFYTLSSTNSTYKIDVDLSNAKSGSTYTPGQVADGITISNTSSSGSLVTLSDLNFINGSLRDILDKNLKIQVINDDSYSWFTKNPVQLALSSALEAEMLKIVENSKTTTVEEKVISDEITKYATVSQDTSWSDKLENERTTVKDITETVTAKGKGIGLTTTNTTNDSIGVIENIDKSVTATREESEITKESAGDTLKLVNQDTTNETKNFKTTSADDTYTVSEDLGSTKNTVNIIGVTSDTAKSTVDLNGETGFVLDKDSKALNLQDVKLTDSSTTDKNLITATTSDATIGLNNAYVEGNIAGSGNSITVNGTGVTTLGGTITNANTELTGGTLAFNTNTFKDSQDKLTVTGGTVDMSNGTIEDYVINELNSSADAKYSIDVNLSGYNKTADRITLNSANSTGTVTIDELNFIGSTTPSSAFELKIIDNSASSSNVQLALTDKVTKTNYNMGTTSRDEKDTVLAKSTSSMVYQTYTRDGQLYGNISTSKSTGSAVYDSIKLAVDESKTVWDTDRTTTGVLGDTLALWNQLVTTEEKIFTVNSTNPTYTVTDKVGTVAGNETVTGKGVTGATIDFNKYAGFNLDGTSASLTIEDVILKNATRTGNGGAISLNNSHLQTNSGTTFSNNTATGNGGAIYLSSGFVDGEANTLYGTYDSNSAANGGAIYVASMEEVANINGTFTSNHAQSGGAIYNNSHLGTVVGTFTSNTASNGTGDAFGGAISNNIDSTIDEITNSTFKSNTAHSAGGAIDNKGTITTISNTTFDGNGLSTNGGAIYNTGTISSIINSDFKNNNTGLNGNGGAIYNTGTIGTVTNTSFTNNSARDKAGAIYTNTNLNIVADGSIGTGKVEFKNNSITSETGTIVDNNAIYVDSSNATLTLNAIKNGVITFEDNIKGSTGYNVAVIGDSTGTLNMHNTISGANLSVNGIGKVNLVDSVARTYDLTSLTSDSAVKWAIDVDAQKLVSDKFTSTAAGRGTVLIDTINWLSAPITSLTGSKIQILSGSNTNSLQIALSDELKNSTWDFGKEDAYNGTDSASATQNWDDALYDWHVTEKIYTGHIQTATTDTTNDSIEITKTSTGGDRVNDTKLDTLAKWNQLLTTDTKNFNFGTENDVYTSTADVGNSVGTTLNVNGVTADGKHSTINLAEHNGFVVDSASTALNINDVNIQNSLGYIIANNSGTVNISNSTLSNNNGVIYNKGTIANILNTVITNYTNTSNGRAVPSTGSAIFNEGTISKIANSSFTNNTSSNNGGAIYNEGIITNISDVTFDSNSATHDGAAIYNASNGNVTVSNSSFVNNTGDSYIYNAGTMKIQDTNLSNQTTTANIKNIGNLTLEATSGKTITVNDIITSGATTTYGNLTLDGNIELNNNVINQNINALVGSTVKLTDSDISGGTLTNNGSINVLVNTGNSSITSSVISGSGSFEKTGAGTLNLSSVNNSKFTGTFTVSNGTVNYQTQSGGSFFPASATLIIDNNTTGATSSDSRFVYNATLTEENLGLGTDYAKVQLGTGTLDFNANSSSVYNIANDWITDKGGSGVLNLNNGRYSLAVDSNSNVALSNLTNDTINISSAILDLNTSNTGNKTYNFGNSNYNLTNSTTMDWSNKIAGDTYNFGGNLSADGSNFSIDIDLTLETDSSGNITTSPISDVIYAKTKYGDSSSLVTLTKIGITDDNGKFIVNPDGTLTKGKIQVFTDKGNTLKVANVENSQILSWATNIYKYGIKSASSGLAIEGTNETRTLDSIEVSPAGYSNNDTLRDLNRYNLNDSDANHNRGFSFIVVKDSSGNVLSDSNKYSIFRDLDTTAEGNFTLVGSYIDANTNSTKSILSGSLSSLEMDEDDWGTRLYQQDGKWYYKADAWDTTGIDVTDNITITGDSPSRHASIATGAFSSDINGSMFEIVNNTNFVASDISFEDAQRVSTETIKDGSVIYANNENATVKLTNTDFKNNTAVNGGAIANINSSTFDITAEDGKTVVISGNRAADNGGAIYNATQSTNGMSIIGATVSENTATIDGGAIYNASKLSINQSAFDKNIAGTETQDGRGGAIYTSANLTITDSNFGVTNKNYNYRNGNKVENDIWVDNTATVTFATGNNGNIINSGLAGSGNFTKTGGTTLTLAGNNSSLTGTTTIQNGILAYTQTNNSSFVGGNVVVGTDAQLNYTNSISDVGMNNVVSGSGKVNKFGTKTLTVTNASEFTGEFNVNEGTLSFVGSTIKATVNNTSDNTDATISVDGTTMNGVINNNNKLVLSGTDSLYQVTGNGNVTVNSGANVTITDSLTQSALTNSGTIANNGSIILNNLVNNTSATITGDSGRLTLNGTSTNSGSITQVNISNTGKLTNDGTLSATDKITNSGSITTNASKISATNGIINSNALTLTGGTLASTVSGDGTTIVNGTVRNSAAISQAVDVTTGGDLTVGANIGNLTNAGKVTANAGNLTGTIENNKDLTLIGGTLVNAVSGDGTTTVNGTVTNSAAVSQAVAVTTGGDLTVGANIGNLTNAGTVTAKADNLTGSINNVNILNLSGTLNKEISGTGTTNIATDLALGESAKIDGTLNMNSGNLTVKDGKTTTFEIGKIQGSGNVAIDVNYTTKASDVFKVGAGSDANIIISSINGLQQLQSTDIGKVFKILDKTTSSDSVQIAISDTIKNNYNKIYGIENYFDTTKDKYILNNDSFIGTVTIDVNDKKDSIVVVDTGTSNPLIVTNVTSTTKEREFTLTKDTIVESGLGATGQGIFTLKGNNKTLTLGASENFDINNGVTFNLSDITLAGKDTVIANKDGILTVDNSAINGNISNDGNLTIKNASKVNDITGSGKTTINTSANVTTSSVEQSELTNEGNLTTGNLNITSSTNNSGTITNNGVNSTVKNLTNSGTIDGTGNLAISGTSTNDGSITQNTIVNNGNGALTNDSTITASNKVENNSTLSNKGTISTPELVNSGTFTNSDNGSLAVNSINNSGDFTSDAGKITAKTTGNIVEITNSKNINLGKGNLDAKLTQTTADTTLNIFDKNNENTSLNLKDGSSVTKGTITVGNQQTGATVIDSILTVSGGTITTGSDYAKLVLNSDAKLDIEGGTVNLIDSSSNISNVVWNGTVELNGGSLVLANIIDATRRDAYNKQGTLIANSGKLTIDTGSVLLGAGDTIAKDVLLTLKATLYIGKDGSETASVYIDGNDEINGSINLAHSGSLTVDGFSTSSSSVLNAESGTLDIINTVNLNNSNDLIKDTVKTTIATDSILNINNGNVTLNGTSTGNISGFDDSDTWSGKVALSGGNLILDSITKEVSSTTYAQTSGTLNLIDGTKLTISDSSITGGTVNVKDATLIAQSGIGTDSNAVTLNVNTSNSIFTNNKGTSNVVLSNNGTINGTGKLAISGTSTNSGSITQGNISNTGKLTNDGTLRATDTITNSGSITTDASKISATNGIENNNDLTLTGGTLASTVSGTGKTTVNGTVTNSAAISQAVNVTTDGYLTVGANIGNLTNAGKVTANAGNLTGTIENNKDLTLIGGTLENAVSGCGKTTIDGKVISNSAIANAISILNDKTLTIGADNVKGSVNTNNSGNLVINADGTLSKTITGKGTTTIDSNVTVDDTIAIESDVLINENKTLTANAGKFGSDITGTITNNGTIELTGNDDKLISELSGNVAIKSGSTVGARNNSLFIGTLTNNGTYNMTDDLNKNILGSGTTVLQNDSVLVTDGTTIYGTLDANGKTIAMSDGANYQTLNVGSLKGDANLSIDVDVTNIDDKAKYNDKINITDGTSNSGTLNLKSINVLESTPTYQTGTYKNFVDYVTGKKDAITYKLDNNTLGTYSYNKNEEVGQYGRTYLFTLGNAGSLNVEVIDNDVTLSEFVKASTDRAKVISTYSINSDYSQSGTIGTTNVRSNDSTEISINLNNGHDLISTNKEYDGVTIADGYKLNITGSTNSDSSDKSAMSNFKTALINNAGGTLNVKDMVFTGNTTDITNNGTTNFTGTNTLNTISGSGNATNAGTLNIAATGLGNTLDNSGILNLGDGTLSSAVSGDGTTIVNGKVTNNAEINQAVNVKADGDLTVGANIGNLTNAGKVTANAGNLTGTIENNKDLTLSGALNKEIAGSGTTNVVGDVDKPLILGEKASIKGVLDLNSNSISTSDNKYHTYEIGSITGNGSAKIDVDWTNSQADTFNTTSGNGTIALTLNATSTAEILETKTIQITKNGVGISLSESSGTKDVVFTGSDDLKANVSWDDTFGSWKKTDVYSEKTYAVSSTCSSILDSIRYEVELKTEGEKQYQTDNDTLALIVKNAVSGYTDKSFITDSATKEYTVKTDLGTLKDNLTIKGTKDGDSISKIDLGEHKGIKIADNNSLTIKDVQIDSKDSNGTIVDATNSNANTTIDNAKINGNISNKGNLTIKNASKVNDITGSGKTTINDSANVTTSSVEQSELTNKGNLTTGNLNITSSTNNSGTITNNGANSTVKNLTNSGTINGTGNLEISETSTNSGSITQGNISNTGKLTNDGTLSATDKIANSGSITTDASKISATNGIENNNDLTLTGGTLASTVSGTGKTTVSGTVTNSVVVSQAVNVTTDGDLTVGANIGNLTNAGKVTANVDNLTGTIENNKDLTLIGGTLSKEITGAGTTSVQGNGITLDNGASIQGTLTLDNGILNIAATDTNNMFNKVEINSGTINLINGTINNIAANSFRINGNTNLLLDVDLAKSSMDRLPSSTQISDRAILNILGMNLLSDSKTQNTYIQFAEDSYKDRVTTSVKSIGKDSNNTYQTTTFAPIFKYDVSYNNQTGQFLFARGGGGSSSDYNPAVLASSVNSQVGAYSAVNETFNYAFRHADYSFMPLPKRIRTSMANRYALTEGQSMPYTPEYSKEAGIWFQPYANFENVHLSNGPRVDVQSYGSLVGGDSAYKELKHGWGTVTTPYIGYNGSSQHYSGVSTYTNGGILGVTQTFYRDNLFTALTVNAGASVGEANTMYGRENFTSLMAGVASKTGYNFEFADGKFIVQPSWMMAYTFVNTFDYTNAAGVRIDSDPLHSIQLHPTIKFMGNIGNGWQPYASVGMVWNILNDTKVMANDVRLPEMSVKPYVEYGVGIQKIWKDKFTGFFQAMLRNGGRNGVALTFGFKWALGNDGKPIEKVENSAPKTVPTVVKSTELSNVNRVSKNIQQPQQKVNSTNSSTRTVIKQLSINKKSQLQNKTKKTTLTFFAEYE